MDNDGPTHPGLFREPLPLSDGRLLAVHTADAGDDTGDGATNSSYEFRIKLLTKGADGFWTAGTPLTNGIAKSISYWSPDELITYTGNLWELNPVEVRARTAPPLSSAPPLAAPEQQMVTQAGVNLAALQTYLVQHDLALAVVRNVTERDDFDLQQPFNLQVPSGVQTVNPNSPGTNYSVTSLQFFQGDQLRGMTGCCGDEPLAGRRVIAQFLHDPAAVQANAVPPANAATGKLPVAADGSVAAFVPARRALTWQLTNASGVGVVRERYWITFQPGEIRTCPACHGLSERDQAGNLAATNPPQALLTLLQQWQRQQGDQPTPTPTPVATPGATPTPIPGLDQKVFLPATMR